MTAYKVYNTYTLKIVETLASSNYFHSLSRSGFLEHGRGAVAVNINEQMVIYPYYRSRNFWENVADLDPERRKHLLEAIDIYQPLSQVVAVTISPIDEDHQEVTTYLIKLPNQVMNV